MYLSWSMIAAEFYSRVTALSSPNTKVLLALGGWTDSTGNKYSKVVSSGSARRALVSSIVAFLRRHSFQGLHLDWNYPVCWHSDCKKGPQSDRINFAKLVQVERKFIRVSKCNTSQVNMNITNADR